jgi:hypothetical protein
MNNLESNTTVLDSAQASAMFSSLTSGGSSSQVSTSKFTNNFRVTGNSSLFPLEDEPSIAVTNQTGHVLMVVGANSLSTGQVVAYVSRDQGTDWIGPSFLPLSRSTDIFASDPALGVNRTGTFFYAFLSIGSSFNGSGLDDLVVATSQDGGNWTNHVAVQRGAFNSNATFNSNGLFDKPYLAVGPINSTSSADAVYITYTDFVDFCSYTCGENSTIMQVHSTDGGVTWSKPIPVSPTVTITSSFSFFPTGRLVQGSMPAVSPAGKVYVAYYDSGKDGWLNGTASVMITNSTDGGKTFSPPRQAALIPQELTYYSGGFFGFRWWSSMFPSMDVAPDGTVYIAYGARQSKLSLDPADVYLVASTDGGVTWTQPKRINDASSQNGAFFAWLKVSGDGVVHIIWGDRRMDPAAIGYDIFYAEATDHGSTTSANSRVTDVGTDPLYTIGFIGDYFNMAVSGNQVYPVWTDGRRAIRPLGREFLIGETDIFVARLGSRDTPSLTLGPAAPAGYTAPVTISGSGLPREAFFVMRMSGVELLSQTYGIILFFSTKEGGLSDIILPNSDYYGAYPIELDEFLSGAPVAATTLYIVDTRSLQVLVTGPSTAFPGDTVTWNLQLVSPSGSLSQAGSTFGVTAALLTSPSGSVQNLIASVKPTGLGSYSLSTTLPTNAALGSYALFVSASQTGPTVQSTGIGTATLIVSLVSQVVDTRSLGVLVTGPSTAFPGDSITWNLQLVSPSGSLSQAGSTISITEALLMSPSGSLQNLTADVILTGPGSYSLSTTLPVDAVPGSYALFVSASQTGPTVQSTGIGTMTLVVSQDLPDFAVIATPNIISTSADSTAASTIIVNSANGFAGTVDFTQSISPSTGLDCSLSASSVTLGIFAIADLSCTGSPGTYTVTITGTGADAAHSTTLTIKVNSAPATIFGVSPLLFYGGTGGIVAVIAMAVVGGLLALRQRGRKREVAETETRS